MIHATVHTTCDAHITRSHNRPERAPIIAAALLAAATSTEECSGSHGLYAAHTPSQVKIALCQLLGGTDKPENLARARKAVRESAEHCVQMVIFPEVFNSPYCASFLQIQVFFKSFSSLFQFQ